MSDIVMDQLTDHDILMLTLYGEARGEPIAGLVAVGCVIRNRVHSGKYKSYKEACLARKQFSCWNSDDSNYATLMELGKQLLANTQFTDPSIRRCSLIATGIIDWSLQDETKGAEHYLTSKLFFSDKKPTWADRPYTSVELGHQMFITV